MNCNRAYYYLVPCIVWLFYQTTTIAQPINDSIYADNIKTVQVYRSGDQLNKPVISLGDTLIIEFDQLGAEPDDYWYSVTHCDRKWDESSISQMEYTEGMPTNHIDDYSLSMTARHNYVHYKLTIPNERFKLLIPGNYIIRVFKDNDTSRTCFVKQFHVVENKVDIDVRIKRPDNQHYFKTKQQLEIKLTYAEGLIRDPSFIHIEVVQNQNPSTLVGGLKPSYFDKESMEFIDNDALVFNGNNQFRHFNTNTVKQILPPFRMLADDGEHFHFSLQTDTDRTFTRNFTTIDINGLYQPDNAEGTNAATDADYVFVHFSLKADIPLAGGDAYVFGAFNNFRCNANNRMDYNFETHCYEARLLLKQGYYDYAYAYVAGENQPVDLTFFEGNFYETENSYQIFVYYWPPEARYETLIGYREISSINITNLNPFFNK
jgi:hypothetical protein